MIYFLYQGILFSCLLYLTFIRLHRAQNNFKFEIGWTLAFIIMTAGFIGGRLLHVLWEDPWFYRMQPIRILQFWQGGFVFYGGLGFAILSSSIYLKLKKESFLKWADFFSPIGALGYAFGRMGCFLSGCCYGDYCDLPWAINNRHPVQLYAFVFELVTLFILLRTEKDNSKTHSGQIFGSWIFLHGLGRIIMESFRADFRGPNLLGFTLATWISLALVGSGFFLIRRNKKSIL